MRRYLEDQMTFLDLAEDYDPSGRTIDVTDSVVQDDEDDDDDEDDEEEEEAFQ
jgi:hypothetical protein